MQLFHLRDSRAKIRHQLVSGGKEWGAEEFATAAGLVWRKDFPSSYLKSAFRISFRKCEEHRAGAKKKKEGVCNLQRNPCSAEADDLGKTQEALVEYFCICTHNNMVWWVVGWVFLFLGCFWREVEGRPANEKICIWKARVFACKKIHF